MASVKQHWIGNLGGMALDIAFPPRCPSCSGRVQAEGNFCAACFDALRLIADPVCASCGVPFAFAAETEAQCPDCLATPPGFDKLRAVMVYDRISAPLISALKFHDQWAGLTRYGQMMAAAGSTLLSDAEMIVPVPLHWQRLLRRRYNQAALLAYRVSEVSGVPCRIDILSRRIATRPQMRLDRRTRLQNVKRAFALNPRAAVKDKHILLVDDVVTTGATVDACARLLREGGAAKVSVLALARTVRE